MLSISVETELKAQDERKPLLTLLNAGNNSREVRRVVLALERSRLVELQAMTMGPSS